MKTVLFLTCRMKFGFGVDVVVHHLGRELKARGYRVVVGCQEYEPGFDDIEVVRLQATINDVKQLAALVEPTVIVAHASPFFELLPALQRHYPCWAWEHGDPTPEFFDLDEQARVDVKVAKQRSVYPKIEGVIAISEFIRQDIGFAAARVIYSGCDHAPSYASKSSQDVPPGTTRPLRIGTLMRLGDGEARYKGNALFRQVCAAIDAAAIPAEFQVMGRGSQQDAAPFVAAGILCHLNGTAAEKWQYLRNLDIFITCSLWEGFNLPLVEAEAVGTLSVAFDTGAHPEVTPFIVGNIDDVVALVQRYSGNRALLRQHAQMCWHFARQEFTWSKTADAFEQVLIAPLLRGGRNADRRMASSEPG